MGTGVSSRQTWGPPERPGAIGPPGQVANRPTQRPQDWTGPCPRVCARACMCVCVRACARACRVTCASLLPKLQRGAEEGGPGVFPPAPHRLRIIQGLFKVSLRIVLVLRMTRLFIFPTRLQVSSQEHLVRCRPNTDSMSPALT